MLSDHGRRPRLVVITLSLAMLFSCRERPAGEVESEPAPGETPGPLPDGSVARVGKAIVLVDEVRATMARTGKSAPAALTDLINFELLANRAMRAVRDPMPAASNEILAQRFLEREFESHARLEDLSDDVLRPFYERAHDAYVHSRLVEISILSIYTGARMKDEPRARRRQDALLLAAHVVGRSTRTEQDFIDIAHDPVWAQRHVQVVRQLQGLDKPFSAKVGAEVAKLKAPGDTTPMVEDETGYHLARYVSEKPPANISFDEAKGKLREAYYPRWRKDQFAAFTQKLHAGLDLEVYPQHLFAEAGK